MSDSERKLTLWVITDHPKDFPDHYVARRWEDNQPTDDIMINNNITEMRRTLAHFGLVCLWCSEGDDPVIVEMWI